MILKSDRMCEGCTYFHASKRSCFTRWRKRDDICKDTVEGIRLSCWVEDKGVVVAAAEGSVILCLGGQDARDR